MSLFVPACSLGLAFSAWDVAGTTAGIRRMLVCPHVGPVNVWVRSLMCNAILVDPCLRGPFVICSGLPPDLSPCLFTARWGSSSLVACWGLIWIPHPNPVSPLFSLFVGSSRVPLCVGFLSVGGGAARKSCSRRGWGCHGGATDKQRDVRRGAVG